MIFMKRASELLTAQEVSSVESAVGEAEAMTSAEIVPVVASVSGRYDRAEGLFGFIFALFALFFCWGALQTFSSTNAWGGSASSGALLPVVILFLIVSFLIGITLASRFPVLRLPLISKQEMREEVELRARSSFQQLKVRKTQGSSGIVIYVSLYERMVHVIGDDAVNEILSIDDYCELRDTVIASLKADKPEEGLRNGVLRSGKLLQEHLPNLPDDKNELANTLHILD